MSDDPTELQCVICKQPYSLNVPRVTRVIREHGKDSDNAKLCWVCFRLKMSAERESGHEGAAM